MLGDRAVVASFAASVTISGGTFGSRPFGDLLCTRGRGTGAEASVISVSGGSFVPDGYWVLDGEGVIDVQGVSSMILNATMALIGVH
jgi:hypothetical protein